MPEQPYLYNDDGYWTFKEPEITDEFSDAYYQTVEIMDSEPARAEKLFKKIITACGNGYVDAFLSLGYMYNDTGRTIEGNALIHKADNIALQAIPKDFKVNNGIIWGILENRPFLRTFHTIGLEYMKEGQYEKAIEKFNFILKVNKGDNQGVRYLLPECYLRLERYTEFIALYKRVREHSIYYDYALFFALYKLKEYDKAKHQFLKAKTLFPYVALELVKAKHAFPHDEFDPPHSGIVMGSRQEAFMYWSETKNLWDKDKEMKKMMAQISSDA